jgi:hypothetical protein
MPNLCKTGFPSVPEISYKNSVKNQCGTGNRSVSAQFDSKV